ncbi:MAG TPA: hypothetical protein VGH37_14540 [Candidatus Acidoferrum sp.]
MKKVFKGLLLSALAAVAILGVQQNVLRGENPGNGNKLDGAWDVVIWLPVCGGDFCATPYRILRTISPVGITDGYGFPALTNTPGAVNSSGHGDYARIGNNLYSATVKYFELTYNSPLPPFGSVVSSIETVQETIALSADGNSYESQFLTTFTSPSGVVLATNGGKTKATRISARPPQ